MQGLIESLTNQLGPIGADPKIIVDQIKCFPDLADRSRARGDVQLMNGTSLTLLRKHDLQLKLSMYKVEMKVKSIRWSS